MNKKTIVFLTLASIILFTSFTSGCTSQDIITPQPTPTTSVQDIVTPVITETLFNISKNGESIVQANNEFSLKLYGYLAKDPENKNSSIFFSPISISSALALSYEGAHGTTADEIRTVCAFPENDTVMREGYSEIIDGINDNSSSYTLRMANALWAEQTYPFLPVYMNKADTYYSAKIMNLDFIQKPEESRSIINRWVENQTEDKIKDLLPAGSINPLTRLVITNAIYFKGTWMEQFEKARTSDEDFRIAPGTTVRVPMMQRTDLNAIFGYAETDTYQVLEMPYASDNGTELSMLVILPKNDDLALVEQSLNAQNLSDIQQSPFPRRVEVFFPKFTMETKYSLTKPLSEMGMPTAFTDAADFSGMDGGKDLYIDEVIHQAFVDVNEEGTEAAAATASIINAGASPVRESVPVFRADHPFIFLIQEKDTGNILFMGRVMNPNSQ